MSLQLILNPITGNFDYIDVAGGASDISETSTAFAQNAGLDNVTGLTFNTATVGSFEALVTVKINATTSLYETFKLQAVKGSPSWYLSQTSVGDNTQTIFSITNAGQVRYTSSSYSGFTSGTIKFRAITLSP